MPQPMRTMTGDEIRNAMLIATHSLDTPKQHVLTADPEARLDYYETLRGAGQPCWFIRRGFQGAAYTEICATPRAAWKQAYDRLLEALRRAAA